MENQHLVVRFTHRSPQFEVYDRRVDFHWKQSRDTTLRVNAYLPEGEAVRARMFTPAGLEMEVTWELAEEDPEIRISLSPEQETSFSHFAYPAPFLFEPGFLVVPHSQGVLYPVNEVPLQRFLDGQMLDAYTSDLSMPWYGVVCLPRAHGCLTILETSDDAALAFGRHEQGSQSFLTAQPAWRSSGGRMAYERSLRLWFHTEGGYVAQAKRYRAHLEKQGFPSSSGQERPERLKGALHLTLHVGQLTFGDCERVCESLKEAGIEKAVVHLRNWQEDPYSPPRHVPPSKAAGGEEGLRCLVRKLHDLGYVPGVVACFRDTFEGFDGFAARATAKGPAGEKVYGGFLGSSRVPALRVCGIEQVSLAREHLPQAVEAGPFECLLLEGACHDARECYDKKHPVTRGEDLGARRALLKLAREVSTLLGAEGAMEFAAPHVDFMAGPMSLARYYFIEQVSAPHRFNLDPQLRVPLFNLVHHEQVDATWHHQDAYLAVEDNGTRALFDILYGNPPAVTIAHPGTVDLFGARIAQLCQSVARMHERTAGQEMELHGWLTDDRLVQMTRFKGGLQVVVNFSRTPYELPNGEEVAPGACQALLPA
jgi:hypothetical protein